MSEDRTRLTALARITDNSQLARAVPLLPPEVLQLAITHFGLQDCGELLTLATPAQLTAVFDLDLWKASRPGADEQFDASRFCEWLEVLVDAGPGIAADRVSKMDAALVVAGLSPQVKVFDPGVFEPVSEPNSADAVLNPGRERGVHAEIGGYVVVARRMDWWDTILAMLTALAEEHSAAFHRVMRGCRRLSNSGSEFDGLDELLSDAGQSRFDLSQSREERRERLGYLPPDRARAFLESARRQSLDAPAPPDDDVTYGESDQAVDPARVDPAAADVIEVLRDAGVLTDAPRALLAPGQEETPGRGDAESVAGLKPRRHNCTLREYLENDAASDPASWVARNQELAFLANTLVGGCSVQGRPFTPREASEAVAATCNLGLECWPRSWPQPSTMTLVTVFQVGWTVLHLDVSMFAAARVIEVLDGIQSSDQDLQFDLRVLRRELHKQRDGGTPWKARGRLEVLATLDLPAWAALMALFDECPVMLSNVRHADGAVSHTVNPAEFQFIADASDIAAIREFLASLPALLTG